MILVCYDDDGKVLEIYPNGELRGNRIYVNGQEVASGVRAKCVYVPDQPLDHCYKARPDGSLELVAKFPDDFQTFTPEEQAQLLDRETGRKINTQTHPFAPIEEQIGILRDQLVHVLNALGIEPTEEFAKLNEIAIREIEAARKKKEALDEGDTA